MLGEVGIVWGDISCPGTGFEIGVGQGQGVGRMEGIWTGAVACANAQWSALH